MEKLRIQKRAVFHLISKHLLNINFLCILLINYQWIWEWNKYSDQETSLMKGFLAVTHFSRCLPWHCLFKNWRANLFATLLINCEDGICLITEILIQVCDIHHYWFRPLGGVLMSVFFPTLVNWLKWFLLIKSPPLTRTLPHPDRVCIYRCIMLPRLYARLPPWSKLLYPIPALSLMTSRLLFIA